MCSSVPTPCLELKTSCSRRCAQFPAQTHAYSAVSALQSGISGGDVDFQLLLASSSAALYSE